MQGLPPPGQGLLAGRSTANVFWCQKINFPPKKVNTEGVTAMELSKELGERRNSNGNDRYPGLCFTTSLVIKEHHVLMKGVTQLPFEDFFLLCRLFSKRRTDVCRYRSCRRGSEPYVSPEQRSRRC